MTGYLKRGNRIVTHIYISINYQLKNDKKMETGKKAVNLERVVGIIFLIPPIIGVLLFLINLFVSYPGDLPKLNNLSGNWTGDMDKGGFMSAAPIYLGLMAIAGALLIKDSKR